MVEQMVAIAELDIDALAPAARVGAYEAFVDILQTSFLSADVQARFQSCYLDDLHVIAGSASPRRTERLVSRIARDRYDGIGVQLVREGRATGSTSTRAIVSEPGSVMVLDYAQPFTVIDDEPRDVVNISIPRSRFLPHVEDVRGLHGLVLPTARGCGALLGDAMRGVAEQMEHLPDPVAPILSETIVKLLLLGLGYEVTADATRGPGRRAAMVKQAQALIEARLGSTDLTPEWLMQRLSVSRSDLYTLFEGQGGVARYIWRRRLEAIRVALLDAGDGRRIGEIAFAHGFSSQAHFARAFQAAFGTTARATRKERTKVDA